jgi:opacity protein-like surface antigen
METGMTFSRLRKLICGAAACLAIFMANSVQADCCEREGCGMCGCGFSGIYLGGSIGYVSSVSKYRHRVFFIDELFRSDFGLEGVDGGVHIGFGGSLLHGDDANLYIGIELGGLVVGARGQSDTQILNPSTGTFRQHSQRAKVVSSVDLSVRLGLSIRNFAMTYIKVGSANTRWEISHVTSPDLFILGIVGGETKRNLTGLLLGIGSEVLVTDHTILGVELSHSMYKRQSFFTGLFNIDPLAKVDFKPRYTRGAFRVSYLF